MAERQHNDLSRGASSDVEQQLQAIDATFIRVSKTRKKAKAFLTRAGILDKKGKLAKAYR